MQVDPKACLLNKSIKYLLCQRQVCVRISLDSVQPYKRSPPKTTQNDAKLASGLATIVGGHLAAQNVAEDACGRPIRIGSLGHKRGMLCHEYLGIKLYKSLFSLLHMLVFTINCNSI